MVPALSQEGFDNRTRAVYIFDIARYVYYGDALDTMAIFKVGVLAEDSIFTGRWGTWRKPARRYRASR
ncbi:MAG: hypothetical protein R2744_05335 [Bacteroidales bacterium]